VPTSVENLAIVWASVDGLFSGFDDAQWNLPTGGAGLRAQRRAGAVVISGDRQLGRGVLEAMGITP
jgi:hypothetical protein